MITVVSSQAMGSKVVNGKRMSRARVTLNGLSTDTKPTLTYGGVVIGNGSTYKEIDTGTEYAYDEVGMTWHIISSGASAQQEVERSLGAIADEITGSRVTSLDGTRLAESMVVDTVGIPTYVDDVTDYAEYGITETGWYVFARLAAKAGTLVTAETTVTGAAGYIKTVGADHVDVAVRFEVAATSQPVTVNWGTSLDAYIFRADDLAIRNLDYRTTFYVYDISDYATWSYKRSADQVYVGTKYYTESEGEWSQVAVKALEPIPADTYHTHAYVVTTDETFQNGVTYYTYEGGVYTAAEVTVGDPVTSDDPEVVLPTYFVDQYTLTTDAYFVGTAYYQEADGEYTQVAVKAGEVCSYYTKVITYPLPTTVAFAGTEYWVQDDSELGYSRAAVLAGTEMTADTYYTHVYTLLTAAGKFAADTRYYKLVNGEYVLQTVTVGGSYAKNTHYVDTWTLQEGTFVGTAYYLEQNGEMQQVAVLAGDPIPAAYYTQLVSYVLTEDETILVGKTYYVEEDGAYVEAEVTIDAEIPANTYYERVITYPQASGTFEDGVTYYTAPTGVYTEAEVTVGETIPTVEYRIQRIDWPQYTEEEFESGETYYTTADKVTYTEADVDAGDTVPVWLEHEKITFAGMAKNVTYVFEEMIDAPVEIVLPEIPDDGHGAWYEIQMRHKTTYSTTLVPPSEDVKISSTATVMQSRGINIIDLHYNDVAGAKVWRMINTHSNFVGY